LILSLAALLETIVLLILGPCQDMQMIQAPEHLERRSVRMSVLISFIPLALLILACACWLLLHEAWTAFLVDTGPVHCATFSPDGTRILYTQHHNGTMRLLDVTTGLELRCYNRHGIFVSISPDGTLAVSPCNDALSQRLVLWNVESGQEVKTFVGHKQGITCAAFSPSGDHIVSGSSDQTVRVWDVGTGRELACLAGHTGDVNALAISPDGAWAVSGSGDYWGGECHDFGCRLWDLQRGKWLRSFRGHTGPVSSVAFSPDGQLVVSGGGDDTLRLWKVATGDEVRCLRGGGNEITSVAFSPDGRHVLSGSDYNGEVKLWDITNGQEIRAFKGHTERIWSVGFSRDGRRAFSTSGTWADLGYRVAGLKVGSWRTVDCTVRIWDVETGTQLQCIEGH
jgi:WD40 repeat protein